MYTKCRKDAYNICIQNVYKMVQHMYTKCVKCIQNMYKMYTNVYKMYKKRVRDNRMYTKYVYKMYKTYTRCIQNVYVITYTECVYKI